MAIAKAHINAHLGQADGISATTAQGKTARGGHPHQSFHRLNRHLGLS
jgi:hypothetical protein